MRWGEEQTIRAQGKRFVFWSYALEEVWSVGDWRWKVSRIRLYSVVSTLRAHEG